ncbi:MAG TPA: hypothetical protein VMR16_01240, partial [Candidatus Saccharimonadales bacterium]|nr:hypothetical protein [Candidatus Saccharimonadales bacterium]
IWQADVSTLIAKLHSLGYANANVAGDVLASSVTDSGLTSGRIPFASTGGLLADDTGLTWGSNILTAPTVSATTIGATTGNITTVNATTVGATTLNAPTGRTANYVIAASDAPASWKAQADYVCTTTDISPAISAGITALSPLGGTIQISPSSSATWGATVSLPDMSGAGTFNTNSQITINGSGKNSTKITLTGNNDMFNVAANFTEVIMENFMVNGNAKSYSFFNGYAYTSTFHGLDIYNFAANGLYFNNSTDSGNFIDDCYFGANGIDILLNNSQGFTIHDNIFGGGSLTHVKGTGTTGVINFHDNNLGDGGANCIGVYLNGGFSWQINNNFFQLPTGNVTHIYMTTDNTSNANLVSILVQGNQFIGQPTSPSTPFIYLNDGTKSNSNIKITSNTFEAAGGTTIPEFIFVTGGGGTYWNNLNISNNQIKANSATVTNGFLNIYSDPRVSKDCVFKNNYSDTTAYALTNCNPFGLLSNPFSAWGTIGFMVGYGAASPTSATVYTIAESDCFITSTGGTVSNIAIKDAAGNTMLTGVTTLTNQFVPIGYSITWTHTGAPTVTVFGN